MKSHTGGVMSLGRGAIMAKSRKQKLNTKSSTEAEVVGASDYLPNTLWAKRFLEAQGYDIKSTRFAQDNQSAIRLEKNGRASAGKQSRHVDIRYFFIKDQVQQEKIDIHYCPTEEMLADFYTKPLQGALFNKFRDVLLGHKPISTLQTHDVPTSCEERVGNNEQERKHCDSGTPDGTRPKTMQARPKTMKSIMKNKASRTSLARVTYADVVRRGKANKSPTNQSRAHSLETIKPVN